MIDPGVYVHNKTGGRYRVIGEARHHETRAVLVVYISLQDGGMNVRPLFGTKDDPDGWLTPPADGGQRFTLLPTPTMGL